MTRPDAKQVQKLVNDAQGAEALACATACFASLTNHVVVWKNHFTGPDPLLWRVAREAVCRSASAPAATRALAQLSDPARAGSWLDVVADQFGRSAAALVRAALLASLFAARGEERHRCEAALAYNEVFGPLGAGDIGARLVDRVVSELRGGARAAHAWEGSTVLLLGWAGADGGGNLCARAESHRTLDFLPDPLRFGFPGLEDDFLQATGTAARYVARTEASAPAVVWWWPQLPASRVGGPSVGGAAAVLFRAAARRAALDPRTAVSVTFSWDGQGPQIGAVTGLGDKLQAAAKKNVARVITLSDEPLPSPLPAVPSTGEPVSVVRPDAGFEGVWQQVAVPRPRRLNRALVALGFAAAVTASAFAGAPRAKGPPPAAPGSEPAPPAPAVDTSAWKEAEVRGQWQAATELDQWPQDPAAGELWRLFGGTGGLFPPDRMERIRAMSSPRLRTLCFVPDAPSAGVTGYVGVVWPRVREWRLGAALWLVPGRSEPYACVPGESWNAAECGVTIGPMRVRDYRLYLSLVATDGPTERDLDEAIGAHWLQFPARVVERRPGI